MKAEDFADWLKYYNDMIGKMPTQEQWNHIIYHLNLINKPVVIVEGAHGPIALPINKD